jgi:hypothetical protein
MHEKLDELQAAIDRVERGLDMSWQTFVNADGTVDGELTVRNLPEDWRTELGVRMLVATLSAALRELVPFPSRPSMGGAFWVSFGIRFGPQNEAELGELAELYKRHRGLLQIGTYPMLASISGAIQVALTGDRVGMRAMIESLMRKRGLPPTVILIRFIWTPDGKRPGHYQGERGERGAG